MRLLELLTEASVFDPKYLPGTEFLLGSGAAAEELNIKAKELGIDLSDVIKKAAGTNNIQGKTIQHGKGTDTVNFFDSKGQEFTVTGTKGKISTSFVKNIANRGEVAEGILGAAMFSKFTKRVGNAVGTVNPSDIWEVISSLKQSGEEEYTVDVDDSNHTVADKISFVLKLKAAPAAALKDPNKKEDYNDLAEAAANYVNSSHAERYSNYFYINGRADKVRVVSDGVTDETMRKTDVEVEVLDHKTGQMKRGKLNVSLKVGPVKQFGQVGGTDYTSMSKLWGYFGINIEPLENHYRAAWQQNPSSALATLYEHISNFVNKELAGDDDKKEYDFIKHLAKAINYFATLEDPTVSLVQLKTKGKYVVLRFNALEPLLKQIDLESAYISNKTMPEIVIRDANTSKILITIRAKNEFKEDGSSYIRNLIEKGPLLEEVASVTK